MNEINAAELQEMREKAASPSLSLLQFMGKQVLSLADALEKAQDSNDHYVGEFNRVMAERDSAYDEIARLRKAVLGSRPFVKLAVTQEQAEASARWHSKAMAALSAIDASLSSPIAPDPAEAMRAKCEDIARDYAPPDYEEGYVSKDKIADLIAALKGKGEVSEIDPAEAMRGHLEEARRLLTNVRGYVQSYSNTALEGIDAFLAVTAAALKGKGER